MENCVFCRIVKGVSSASIVYSHEKAIAFMDIQPVNPGHVLVIPKAHAVHLSELDEDTGAHMFWVAIRVSEALKHTDVKCEGINLHLADGEVAGQEVFHVHLHVIPRFRGDGFSIKFGPDSRFRPERKELDEIASKIRTAMK
jgi:histidine triad (HIT) family protein